MAVRCPASKPLGTARLMRHRLVIMREGWASVARAPQGAVWGVLWDLALRDVAALDRFESLHTGPNYQGSACRWFSRPASKPRDPSRSDTNAPRRGGRRSPGYLHCRSPAEKEKNKPAYARACGRPPSDGGRADRQENRGPRIEQRVDRIGMRSNK